MKKFNLIESNNAGFTLIEMVVVIIILAVLAIIAAPKFLNLKTDASIASLDSLEAAIKSANSIIYSKLAIEGKEKLSSSSIELNGETITTSFGFISPTADNIENAIEGSFEQVNNLNAEITADWGTFEIAGILVLLFPKGYTFTDTCYFFYLAFPGATEPSFFANQTGC
ncbi:prepilin-type N-terminal cleavage/methylation domain-containing protein [Shewanella japonica]|uniref:prepilin-type N-terminal cleavage/methylation domain-containing protein n=1 Tax=Shewanella japonica TaxID=93973 RepID=UPI000E71750B|nr:prepilin-type N-terminal cleavage/methylation domain-containing protein [Shewanella japonica]